MPNHRCRLLSLLALLVASGGWPLRAIAQSAATTARQPPSFAGELLGIVLPLTLIIAGLIAVLLILRRRYGITSRDAPLSIVQILPVGPRDRIVLVRTRANRVFAVGVSAQSVQLIAELTREDLEADHASSDMTTDNTPPAA